MKNLVIAFYLLGIAVVACAGDPKPVQPAGPQRVAELAPSPTPGETVVGGGDHKVTSIHIATAEGPTDGKLGQPIQLVVEAFWAIPSLTDETTSAAYNVEPAAMGVVDKEGVFTPAKAGEVRITASYDGFTKSLALTITE